MSFLYLLSLILVIAKIFGMLNISWLLVFVPALIQLALIIITFVIVLIAAIIKDK